MDNTSTDHPLDLIPERFSDHNIKISGPPSSPDVRPIYADREEDGFTTCWKAHFWQRIIILITGRLWIRVHSAQIPAMGISVGNDKGIYEVERMTNERGVVTSIIMWNPMLGKELRMGDLDQERTSNPVRETFKSKLVRLVTGIYDRKRV